MRSENGHIKHRFHGRRKGKPLTALRQAVLDKTFPSHRIDINRPLDGLSGKTELWLEIGFGNGEYLSHMAQARPDIGFIGCEPFINGIAALLTSLQKPAGNLKIWDDNARILMDALPDGIFERIYLLNSDPWPKTRHHKRRFVQTDTLDDLSRILKPGGLFIMSTDVAGLAEWMHARTWAHDDFEWQATSAKDWLRPPSDWPIDKTRYMRKGLGGTAIYWLIFKKKA